MLPHFLGIGAPRTGTTWLHSNLMRHPDIWMPPMKEIHYFDRPHRSLRHRLRGHFNIDRNARRRLLGALKSVPWKWRQNDAFWLLRFILLPRSDRWYESLFPAHHLGRIGEITPGYAHFDEEQIERIHRLMPDARIIYILRNPIEMAWSLTLQLNRYRRQYPLETWSRERLLRHLTAREMVRIGDYDGNLQRWEKIYGADRILVAFHEDLRKDPVALYQRILAFLELGDVDDEDIIVERVNVNKGSTGLDPTAVLPALAACYYDGIIRAHQRFQNAYTAEWVERADGLIRDNPTPIGERAADDEGFVAI